MKQVLCVLAIIVATLFSFNSLAQIQTVQRPAGIVPFLQYLPPDYSETGEASPLIIFMHGSGEKGDGSDAKIWLVAKNGPPKLIEAGDDMCFTVNGQQECFMVVSPQISSSWQPRYINNLIAYLLENYNVDASRIYLTGLSLGGAGTYTVAGDETNEPNQFAAIAPVAAKGACDDATRIGQRKIPVWQFHGEVDTSIPLAQGIQVYECIFNGDPDPEPIMTIYPGVGHNAWDNAYRTDHNVHNPNLYEWFLSYKLPQGNLAPSVNLGSDKTITLPVNSITLTSSVTSVNPISSYSWTKVSGPAATLTNSTTPTLTVTNMLEGVYEFRMTATDANGLSGADNIQVIVLPEEVNQAPTANAGADQTIGLPTNSTTFAGSGSDSDGSIVSYLWTKVSGPAATMQNTTTSTLTAMDLVAGTYVFRLTVTDDDGATGVDDVKLTVEAANQTPTANAGSDKVIKLPTNSVVLSGSGSDPDGTIASYAWIKISGPSATLQNQSTASLTVTNMLEGIYTFRLTVTDNDGATAYDEVKVTVEAANQTPFADAGPDISIKLPVNSTNIVGSGSDTDGSIVSYLWEKVSGPSATLTNLSNSTLSVSNLVEGTYLFGLTVTDNEGATAYDEMTLVVNQANQSPVANAGSDVTINLSAGSLLLNGSGSDVDGSIVSYLWQKKSGGALTLTNADKPTLTISNFVAGTYVLTLTVTDNEGATGTDEVTVIVLNTNNAPTANAGPDQTLKLPINSTTLNGTGSDTDGTIESYEWIQISGPAATMTNANTPTLTVTSMVEGTYIFGLTVTDDDGASDYDEAMVIVNAANQSPSVNAGPDIDIQLPTNIVNISAAASDPDGSISSYLWTKVSGPAAILENANTSVLTAGSLMEGIYVFSIMVTDNEGATATDQVTVTVSAANQPPVANAGNDRSITLPTNTLTISGAGTDNDGSVVSYSWTKVSGGTATLTNSNTATLTVSNLLEGVYVFGLTVTDDDGATGYDEITITVNPEPVNQVPVVNAGEDQVITLPLNTATFTAIASDIDGSIATYLWEKTQGPNISLPANTSATITINNLVAGNYIFRITVTDNDGATAYDDVALTVYEEAINEPPTVNVGFDIYLQLPSNSASVNASSSDDGSIVSYLWEQISGPNTASITNSNQEDASFSDLIEGTYVMRLTVTDDEGAENSDELMIIVSSVNQLPVVDAGADRIIDLPTNSISLTATANDPDGSIAAYMWTKVSGPSGEIFMNQDEPTVTITQLVEGTYVFNVLVTDNDNATAEDQVTVAVQYINQVPVVSVGPDVEIQLPTNTLNLTGSANDPDGSIASVLWTRESGPTATMQNQNTLTLTLTNLLEGRYHFMLTVTDNEGATSSDGIVITVLPEDINQSPVAEAGPNKSITLPTNATTIAGSGSDPDGTIVSYLWTKISGPTASLSNVNKPTLSVNNLLEGRYVFRLTVTDDDGATAIDHMALTVNPEIVNQAPTANAGSDISITLPTNILNINGSGSDPDGSIVSYNWTKQSGPSVTISNNNASTLALSDLVEGVYIFRLTVTDDDGASAFDEVQVTVNPEIINQSPVAEAGSNITITLPTNSVVLNGSGTDNDGTIVSYNWIKVSGPSVTLQNTTSPSLSVTNLLEGSYVFRLTVTDDDGATGVDHVRITVNPEILNQAPTANAGGDIILTLPINSVTVLGSASDPDGTITSYQWTKVNGPAATISNQNSSTLVLNDLVEGTYVFRLTVMDNDGASAIDDVQISVLPNTTNQAPTANAGADKIITLPTNTVVLNGSGADPDGAIVTYQWIKLRGPSVTLSNTNTPNLTLTNLVEGSYQFRLTVIDDDGARGSDNVTVTVVPASTNQNPIVNAGTDITIYTPTSTVNLRAEASDADGNITSYLWGKSSGPGATLINSTGAVLTVNDLVEGVYVFRITVIDDQGASSFDEVKVNVLPGVTNQPPVANAGPDLAIELPTNVANLIGTGSDQDGTVVLFQWVKLSGPSVSVMNSAKSTATLTDLQAGTYVFRLTVTDDDGATGQDLVTVSVSAANTNRNPVANAGTDKEIILPKNFTYLIGSGSDIDGTITGYEWEKVFGPQVQMSGENTFELALSDLVEGLYEFRLIVTDDDGATGSDFVLVNVKPNGSNKLPVAFAGDDIIASLPLDSLVLTGYGEDEDGQIVGYQWQKLSGPSATIMSIDSTLVLKDLVAGVYSFKLVVRDNDGEEAEDVVNVTVFPDGINESPVVSAGPDRYIDLPQDTVTIHGKYTDNDGDDVTISWKKLYGPEVEMSDQNTVNLLLSGLVNGKYEFELTVTDTEGASGTDRVRVWVYPLPEENVPPEAFAGDDFFLTYPVLDYKHVGTGSDPDGLIVSYQWNMLSGPVIDNFPINSDTLLLDHLEVGEYIYELSVMDNDSIYAYDDVHINVLPNGVESLGIDKFFTPDGNGVGDEWIIEHTDLIQGCEVSVYSRFGSKVYETIGYNNDWDGTSGGKPLPEGDYYYVIRCGGKDKAYSGGVRIIRKN